MPKQPKPATVDADSHREDDEDDEQDHADIPDGATPSGTRDGGDGGGGGGGGGPDAGGAGGALSFLKSKNLLLLAGGVVAAYLIWQVMQSEGDLDISTVSPAEEEVGEEEEEDPMPDITQDPNDPLKADDEAFDYVFGEKSNYDGGS